MKWPSSRNSLPNGAVSCTSTVLERRAEFLELARRPDEESPVVGQVLGHCAPARCRRQEARRRVRAPQATSRHPCHRGGSTGTCPPRLQCRLQRAEDALGLVGVVGRVVAHVDVDGDEARFRPRVDREMRLGEQHRSGDALRLELIRSDRRRSSARTACSRLDAKHAQRIGARELRRVGRAAVPFA